MFCVTLSWQMAASNSLYPVKRGECLEIMAVTDIFGECAFARFMAMLLKLNVEEHDGLDHDLDWLSTNGLPTNPDAWMPTPESSLHVFVSGIARLVCAAEPGRIIIFGQCLRRVTRQVIAEALINHGQVFHATKSQQKTKQFSYENHAPKPMWPDSATVQSGLHHSSCDP